MKLQSQSGGPILRILHWADKENRDITPSLRLLQRLVRLILIIIKEFQVNDLSLRSGALTYTALLSLVPILAFSTAAVKGLGGGNQIREAAYSYIAAFEQPLPDFPVDMAPTPGSAAQVPALSPSSAVDSESLTAHLRLAVDTLFDYVDKTDFATLGTIGVLGILLSVVLVLGHIEAAMNTIWKVSTGRSLGRKITDYLTLMILMPVSINIAFAASAFLKNPTLAAKLNMTIPFPWIQTLLLQALPVLFITATFQIMFIFFPNTKVKTFPSILGALLAANFWFLVQNIYISLQVGVANYNAIYGSFATLPLFLVWMYLAWMFILIGAQVTYALQNFRSYRLIPVIASPATKLSAAFDMMNSLYKHFNTATPVTLDALKDELQHSNTNLLDEVLLTLQQKGLIHLSQDSESLLPAGPQDPMEKAKVVSAILGDTTPDSMGGAHSKAAVEAATEAAKATT